MHELEQYILMCLKRVEIPQELCDAVSKLEEAPAHLSNYKALIQGGDPANKALQEEVVFFISLDCQKEKG